MKFEESQAGGHHSWLAKLIGEWEGTTKTWFEPDKLADESPMTGKMSAILGGRFILHEYAGRLMDKPFEGMAIYGFDLATNKFQSSWVDSFHMSTAIMLSEGNPGDRFSAFGTYFTGEDTPRWGWRTEIDIIDDDKIIVTAYNISPEGDEVRATERGIRGFVKLWVK